MVNQYFPPDTSATAEVFDELVSAISAAGHEVTVLTGRPSYAPHTRSSWRLIRRVVREDDVRIITLGSTAFDRARYPGRIANYLTFLFLAAVSRFFSRRADVVICGTDPPLAVAVALIAARGRPVVYAVQDLHPDALEAAGEFRARWLLGPWDGLHRWALRKCAHVVCLGSDVAARVREKGVPTERVSVIRTGSAPAEGIPDPAVVADLRRGADIVIVHAGNLGTAGPWDEISQGISRVEGVKVVFVGEGIFADRLRVMGLDVRPFLPRNQLASVMAAGDLQMVALKANLSGLVVPSKLYTALAHGRPVLAVVPSDSEVAEIVRTWECGIVIEPDAGAISAALADVAADPDRMRTFQRNSSRAAEALARSHSLDAWISLVERLA